jgi:dTDP-4-amino-4,6-dideoxygalactose transaminase
MTTSAEREVPFGRPWIEDADREAVLRVLAGPILTHGPECKAFETEFAAFMGPTAHAVSVSSCMAALHLAYLHLGVGPGDEVIVPAQTHVATVHAVEWVGARPVFVDCDPATGNLTADRIAPAIGPKTRAIGLVHFCGVPCDMAPIMDLARARGVKVVEDCAIAIGARVAGTHVGLFGDMGCFSFYPVKHITTAEGGMFVSRDADTVAKVARLRAFGVDRTHAARAIPGIYDVPSIGLNYRMSEMQAALGRTQVQKLPEILRRRAANFAAVKEAVEATGRARVLDTTSTSLLSSHYCAVAVLDARLGPRRDEVVKRLNARGVGTSVYYPHPVPRLAFYREKYGYDAARYPNATRISDHGFALPVGPHLSKDDVAYITRVVPSVLKEIEA